MKVAIFRKVMSANWNVDAIIKQDEAGPHSIYANEYTQLTNWSEVEFVPLSDEQVVTGQLKQLDTAEQELRKQFAAKLSELAEARSKLLSLTHEVAS